MEHIVQFAIGIDDAAIQKAVMEHAERQIIEDIKRVIVNRMFQSRYYGRDPEITDPLSETAKEIIENVFSKYHEEIVSKAAQLLADKLARSKTGKAILDRIVEEE